MSIPNIYGTIEDSQRFKISAMRRVLHAFYYFKNSYKHIIDGDELQTDCIK